MLESGPSTDRRIAREVYHFSVDDHGRIFSDDDLGRLVAVPDTLTCWSYNRLAARQLLDYCAEERSWGWCLERTASTYRMTFWVRGRPFSYTAATEALAICGAALLATTFDRHAMHEHTA